MDGLLKVRASCYLHIYIHNKKLYNLKDGSDLMIIIIKNYLSPSLSVTGRQIGQRWILKIRKRPMTGKPMVRSYYGYTASQIQPRIQTQEAGSGHMAIFGRDATLRLDTASGDQFWLVDGQVQWPATVGPMAGHHTT